MTQPTLATIAAMIPARARTVAYAIVLAVGAALTIAWEPLAAWAGEDTLGRVASAVALVSGALGSAYRPTRELSPFHSGEAGEAQFDEGDAETVLAELERGEGRDPAAAE